MLRTASRSGAAPGTARSGQRRSWRSRPRAEIRRALRGGVALLGAALLLAGCSGAADGPDPAGGADGGGAPTAGSADPETSAASTAESSGAAEPSGTAEPSASADASATGDEVALAAACTTFWGDPDYIDPVSRQVLSRAATAAESGPADPAFYALTGDAVETAFADAPTAEPAATELAAWFRTQPERGAEADSDAFRSAWEGVAALCRDHSAAAAWALGPVGEGSKPAALVCAGIFDTPGTLTHFANANVLTSNMFKLVGLGPREVPADRMGDVEDTSELLAAEIAAVDDQAVRTALVQVRAPFEDALDGDTRSAGLGEPLTGLAAACEQSGYAAPEIDAPDPEGRS